MSKLAFVILTWNSEMFIERCLRSIFEIKSFEISVYVVDNGSSDKTVSKIRNFKRANLHLTELLENKGTTFSRNLALKQIPRDVDFICVLDSDTAVNDEAMLSMSKCLENKKIGIVGPEMRDEKGVLQNSGRKVPTLTVKFLKVLPVKKLRKWGESLEFYENSAKKMILPVGYLMSACWMFRPEILEKVGFLDENIFYAPEDVDFCLSCWNSGYGIVKDLNAKILHSWQRISRKKILSKHNWEHIKGLVYLFKKYKYVWTARKIEKLVDKFDVV